MTRDDSQRIAITGMGAVSAFGIGAPRLWQSLRDGQSGIRPLRHPRAADLRVRIAGQVPDDIDLAAHLDVRLLPQLDRTSQLAMIAAAEAIAMSGLDFSQGDHGARTGVVIGTGVGGETSQDEQCRRLYADNATRAHPLSIVRVMTNAAASQIGMGYGLRGPSFAVASACASTYHAIAQAALLLRAGMADAMVVGGSDAAFSYGVLKGWDAMRVLSDDACRPFSANRRGLVLAEGAGVFVLERWDSARRRGAPILAELAGVGMSADAGDIVAPDPGGSATAMRLALADAQLAPENIDYINAHGTGTQANDIAETLAIHRCFGEAAKHLAVSSTKSMHGHALGASGALELVAVLGAIRERVLPPTMNLDAADPACDLDYVPNAARDHRVRAALTNAFAFGGLNAVLALRAA